ncbi:hypothetical protein DH2020_023507 [Rehmannia glutinosa]|uniref:Chaperonin-like RbcX protein n=1 Tax=Rehmannia glutinosa TaxID=99300 RepID=A0ABR0WA18_REHGL
MAGTTSVKSFTDSLSSCPCLCLHSTMSSSTRLNIKTNGANSYYYNNLGKRRQLKKVGIVMKLGSPFLDAWQEWRLSATKMLSNGCSRKRRQKFQGLIVVDNLGGQYEDTFNDVKMELINYFTFKAVRTVLEQLYEMNPPQYKWFNNFVADNVPNNGKRFLQTLVKKCNHGEIYEEISEENLKLMRERLLETIQWPSDDNTKPDGDKTAD